MAEIDIFINAAPVAIDVSAAQGPGGGVSDHGELTGLADDDHLQYHTDARGDARYAPASGIEPSAITGTATVVGHTHTLATITDAGTAAGNATGDFATAAQGTDARTPTAHKSTHATGGADVLLPGDIGAMANTNAAVNAAIATNPAATRKTIHTRRGLNNIPYPNYIGHRGAAGLYPQSSQMAFDAAVAFGMPIMEPDVFALADGTLLVAHGRDELLLDGVIPPNMTEILTFDEAEARARLRISPIGYATWSGSPIYGFEGMDIPILTFEDMLKLYGNKVILLPDMKSSGRPIAVHVIEQLEAYGIEKDMVLIGGGILAEAQIAAAAGWTTGLWSIAPADYAARLADGIEWNGLNWADTAGITGSKAAGMRVAVSSVSLHWQRDAAIADGAELLWTPQVLYVPQHDRHRLVYDPYPLGKTYHGHTTTNRTKARVIDGKIDFVDAAADLGEEVLLGWAGPTKSPFDFVFDFTLNYTALSNATRFVSIWLSDTDRVWKGGSAPTWFGFDILARANGDLQIYQYNGGVDGGLKSANTGNDALTLGVDYDFRLTVTQTSIKLENLTNALETVWDTTLPYKKYLSLRCSGADAKVSKMMMRDNSKSDLLTPENLGVATSDQGTTADSALPASGGTATNLTLAGTVTTDPTSKVNLRNAAGLGTGDSVEFAAITGTTGTFSGEVTAGGGHISNALGSAHLRLTNAQGVAGLTTWLLSSGIAGISHGRFAIMQDNTSKVYLQLAGPTEEFAGHFGIGKGPEKAARFDVAGVIRGTDLIATGNLTASGTITLGQSTVATLPTASASTRQRIEVSDALTPTIDAAVVGGGAETCTVRSDGTDWIVIEIL